MAQDRNTQRVSMNRFGESQIIKSTRPAKGKDGLIDAIQSCYVELSGKLYKITVTEAKSDKVADKGGKYWVTVTKKDMKKASSM